MECRNRVRGVERRQHEVSREGGLDSNAGCFNVSDLAHEDDIGVLSQYGTKAGRKRESCLLVCLNLVECSETHTQPGPRSVITLRLGSLISVSVA